MVSIIIINYRQKDFVTECVESLRKEIQSPYEIIIVNNSPTEDLRHLEDKATIIPNANKGFSQANNLAAKKAKGDHLLFLNADTVIGNDFLNDAVKKIANHNAGAMGMKMYNNDGSFQLSFWKENTIGNEKINKRSEERFKNKEEDFIKQVEDQHSEITEVDWVSGAAMMIKKGIFEEIGGFDEDFFLFYEDADICKRLKDNGHKIYFFSGSDILHYKGENVNEEFSDNTYFHAKRSQLLYYKKHNPLSDRVLLRLYLLVKFGLKYLTTFRSINLKIFLLILGLRSRP
jgi:GT2 family glycosyltransferase